jgi:serine/threonine protein kinase
MADPENEFRGTERFEIRRRLGAGGMGVVYEAYDRQRSEVVALKTLRRQEASSDLYFFKNEFRTLADVAHPNLINLYEFLVDGDRWFFTMELVDGMPFLEYVSAVETTPPLRAPEDPLISSALTSLAASQPLSSEVERPAIVQNVIPQCDRALIRKPFRERELRSAVTQLAEGLIALHVKSILHRDIKSSNVLVTAGGRVVILDFGISTERATRPADDRGLRMGTPSYMSPEQVLSQSVEEASDWYSVGVLLYRALTGRFPFEGSIAEILQNKLRAEPVPPSELVEDVPDDLSSLSQDLLRRRPQARPRGREVIARLAESSVSPRVSVPSVAVPEAAFVGRDGPLEQLADAFETVRAGTAVSVYIHGASGMGKSALVRRFLDSIEMNHNALVLAGRCYERESVPYKAVDAIIDQLSRYLASLPVARRGELVPADIAALSRLFPALRRFEGRTTHVEGHTRDLLALRREGFAALRQLMGRVAEQQPLVLSIDDLQWSDADSIVLLDDLLRLPDPPRLLLLTSFRSEEIDAKPFLQDLLEQAGGVMRRQLRLEPMTADESRRLAHAVLGRAHPASDALIQDIVTEAAGSPFLVEQLAISALHANAATARGISLADMVSGRVRQLPPGAQPILMTLAVAGRPVESAVAYAATHLMGDERPLVAALRAARLVRSSGSAERVELYHDRIRETLVALIQPGDRRHIHLSLAETLETRRIDDPEGLYEHFMNADQPRRAGVYAMIAASKAAGALAFDQAAVYYRRALDVAPVDGVNTSDLQANLAEALVNAGRSSEAAAVFLDLADHVDSTRALDLQRRAAEQLLMSGRTDQGIDVIRRVLAQIGLRLPEGSKRVLCSLLVRRAHLRLRGLSFLERDLSEIPPEDLQRIDICWAVAAGLSLTDTIRGADFQTRNLLLALRAGEVERIARAIAIETGFSSIPGGPNNRRAVELQRIAEALAQRVGRPHAIGVAALWTGVAASLFGEWKKGYEYSDRALDILTRRCVGVALDIAIAQRFLLFSLMYLGEIRELCRRFPMTLAAAKERGNRYLATDLRTAMNMVWLVDDDPGRAREEVISAMGEFSSRSFLLQHYCALHALTQADLYTGAGIEAVRRVEEQWPALKQSLLLRIQTVRIEARYLRARSALAAAMAGEDQGRCIRVAERMARSIADERMRWSKPIASLLWAASASLRGNHARAIDLLSSAVEGFSSVDMALYAAVARRQMGELLGDDAGRQMVTESDRWMTGQTVKHPQRLAQMLAPGFRSRSSQTASILPRISVQVGGQSDKSTPTWRLPFFTSSAWPS